MAGDALSMRRLITNLAIFGAIVAANPQGEAVAGPRELQILDDVKAWAKKTTSDVQNSLQDGWKSSSDWAAGTIADVQEAYDDAKTNVQAKSEELGQSLIDAGGSLKDAGAVLVAGYSALKDAFPSCQEISYVVQDQLNQSIDNTIEELFAFEACLQDLDSPECLTFLEDTLVNIIYKAIWTPVDAVFPPGTPRGSALMGVKTVVKPALTPPIREAARPSAIVIHSEISKLDVDMTDQAAAIRAAEQKVSAVKNDMLRATGAALPVMCEVIGLALCSTSPACAALELLARASEEASAAHRAALVLVWADRKSVV